MSKQIVKVGDNVTVLYHGLIDADCVSVSGSVVLVTNLGFKMHGDGQTFHWISWNTPALVTIER